MHYFLRIPIENQLRAIINSDTYNLIDKEINFCSDVMFGTFYKSLVKGVISGNDITLQFNVDGVQLCRSSALSL